MIETRTIEYITKEFKFEDDAKEYLLSVCKTQLGEFEKSGVSQYQTIDGVKYDRELMDLAKHFMGDGVIEKAEAVLLWNAALDGNVVTDIEQRSLRKIMKDKKMDDDARKHLEE